MKKTPLEHWNDLIEAMTEIEASASRLEAAKAMSLAPEIRTEAIVGHVTEVERAERRALAAFAHLRDETRALEDIQGILKVIYGEAA